jgi:hypothetical protein
MARHPGFVGVDGALRDYVPLPTVNTSLPMRFHQFQRGVAAGTSDDDVLHDGLG